MIPSPAGKRVKISQIAIGDTTWKVVGGLAVKSGSLYFTDGVSWIKVATTAGTAAGNADSLGSIPASGYVTIATTQTVTGRKTLTDLLQLQDTVSFGSAGGNIGYLKVFDAGASGYYSMISPALESFETAGSSFALTIPAKSGTILVNGDTTTFRTRSDSLYVRNDLPDIITATKTFTSRPYSSSFGLDTIQSYTPASNVVVNDSITLTGSINKIYLKRVNQIYAMGNSLTAGGTYIAYLESLLGSNWDVANLGVSGNTTTQMSARFSNEVVTPNDGLYVIILGGINDVVNNVPAATIEANLQSMYSAASAIGMNVVAVYITPFKGYSGWNATKQATLDSVNTWIGATATDIDYIVDAYTELENSGTDSLKAAYASADWLHLSTAGYDTLAAVIYRNVTWTLNTTFPTLTMGVRAAQLNQNLSTFHSPSFTSLTLSRNLSVYGTASLYSSLTIDNTANSANPFTINNEDGTRKFAVDTNSIAYVNTISSNTLSSVLTLDDSVLVTGILTTGEGTGEALNILNGASGSVKDIRMQTAGSLRWLVRSNATAESGSNVGSDFQIIGRTDAGGALANHFTITRSTGAISLGAIDADVSGSHGAYSSSINPFTVYRLSSSVNGANLISFNMANSAGSTNNVTYARAGGVITTNSASVHSGGYITLTYKGGTEYISTFIDSVQRFSIWGNGKTLAAPYYISTTAQLAIKNSTFNANATEWYKSIGTEIGKIDSSGYALFANSGTATIGAGDSVQVTVDGLTTSTGHAVVSYRIKGATPASTVDTVASWDVNTTGKLSIYGKFGYLVSYWIGKK